MSVKNTTFLLAFILVLSLILSGCIPLVSSEFSLNIELQESWTFNIIITPIQGYEEQLLTELNSRFANNPEFESMGVTVDVVPQSHTPEGYAPIKVSLKGKGYDSLNDIFGDGAITVNVPSGQRQLYFDIALSEMGTAQSTTFTLSGGEILDHNGTLLDNHTVVWSNYTGRMQATMVEPSLLDYWLYAAIVVILVLFVLFLIVLAIGLSKSSKARKLKAQRLVRIKTCVRCGSGIPAHAVFCPNCGAQQN